MAPLDVVTILNDAQKLEVPFILPALVERIKDENDKEYAELEALEWQNRKKDAKYSKKRETRLAELRHSVSQRQVARGELFLPDKKWKNPHGIFRIETGAEGNGDDYTGIVGFRTLLHNKTDNQHFYSSYNTLEVLGVSINVEKDKVSLRQIDFTHIRFTPIHYKFFNANSFEIYSGYQDDNFRFDGGFGKSIYLHRNSRIAGEFMLYGSRREKLNYLGIDTQITKHSTGKFRYGLQYQHLYDVAWGDLRNEFIAWNALDITTNFGLYLQYGAKQKEKGRIEVKMRYYF
jgi:hypothetical protein